jgi:hypothetical protein
VIEKVKCMLKPMSVTICKEDNFHESQADFN